MPDQPAQFTIEREDYRYVGRVAGMAGEAELTFTQKGAGLVSADHAFAPPHLRGTGIARALVERMVRDARAEGHRIVPRCPYVRAQMRGNAEWAELIAS